jgi:hypothetical protein
MGNPVLNSQKRRKEMMMPLDIPRFFKACNPSKTIAYDNPAEREFYIDFAPVRGTNLIHLMEREIQLRADETTCQLFTGHIGCGKSTELFRLKAELEQEGFYVVYFESSQLLDMADVDITDILLAIAQRVSERLEADGIRIKPNYFRTLFAEIGDILQTPIDISQVDFSVGIAKITARTKDSPRLRDQLRQRIEPRTNSLLQSINNELLGQAKIRLEQQGKQGLVVIIDNLDRVDQRQLQSGRTQPEYLFIDRGEQLARLNCHVVYTIPLALVFSNEVETLRQRLGGGIAPQVLPMVPARKRSGEVYEQGLALLRQMILARAFPSLEPEQRVIRIPEIFQEPETLDRLCLVSGGHVRNLLALMYNCLRQDNPPFSRAVLETVIREQRDSLERAIDENEWELIFQVVERQSVRGDLEFQALLRSMFIFEYRDEQGGWYGINPVLEETQKYQTRFGLKRQNGE